MAVKKSVETFLGGEDYCEAIDKTLPEMEEEMDEQIVMFERELDAKIRAYRSRYQNDFELARSRARQQDRLRAYQHARESVLMEITRLQRLTPQEFNLANKIIDLYNAFVECAPEKEEKLKEDIRHKLNPILARKLQEAAASRLLVLWELDSLFTAFDIRLIQTFGLRSDAEVQLIISNQLSTMQSVLSTSNLPSILYDPIQRQPRSNNLIHFAYLTHLEGFYDNIFVYNAISKYFKDTFGVVNANYMQVLAKSADTYFKYFKWTWDQIADKPQDASWQDPWQTFCTALQGTYSDLSAAVFENPQGQRTTLRDECRSNAWLSEELNNAYRNIFSQGTRALECPTTDTFEDRFECEDNCNTMCGVLELSETQANYRCWTCGCPGQFMNFEACEASGCARDNCYPVDFTKTIEGRTLTFMCVSCQPPQP